MFSALALVSIATVHPESAGWIFDCMYANVTSSQFMRQVVSYCLQARISNFIETADR